MKDFFHSGQASLKPDGQSPLKVDNALQNLLLRYTALMKYLGIDYGAQKLGMAVSDPSGMIAFPKEELPNNGETLKNILDLIQNERVDVVVMGDTRTLSGEANTVTPEADAFAKKLEESGVNVERIWEAWSTFEAARFAPENDRHNDSAAAAVILQRYLDIRPK
jgi:putative Holliday junction resolvase